MERKRRAGPGRLRATQQESAPSEIGRLLAAEGGESGQRARLEAIVNTAVDAILTIDEHGQVESMNPAAERMFGYPVEAVLGKNVKLLMPEPYAEEHDGYLERYLTTGERRIIGSGREVEGRRQDGSTFPLHLSVSQMQVAGRRMFTGIARDISQLKEAQAAERSQKARLEALVNTAADAILTIDEHGSIESLNVAAEREFGYSAAEILGKNIRLLMPSPYAAEHDGYLERYQETGEERIIGKGRDVWGLRQDGSTFPLHLSVSKMQVDGRTLFTGIARNITERHEAEDALRRADLRRSLATEAAQIGIWEWDPRTNTILWDAQMFRIYGLEPRERGVVDYSLWREAVLPEELAEQEALLQKTARTLERGEREFRIRRPDGEIRTIHAIEIAQRGEDGETECVVGTNRDITETRAATATLIQHQHQLEALVAERTEAYRRLEQSSETLDRTNLAQQQFIYIVSHDLREPINTITNFTGLLFEDHGESLDQDSRRYLEYIRQGAERIRTLLDDLLGYVRLERTALQSEPVDLDATLDDVRRDIDAAIQQRSARLESQRLPVVPGQASLLRVLLQNLVDNATKFRDPERDPVVRISWSTNGTEVELVVADNGIGIDPAHLERTFEMFRRLHSQKKYPGTGIGLAMCKKIVQMHGGRIWLESTPGVGTRVHVVLPADPREEPQTPRQSQQPQQP